MEDISKITKYDPTTYTVEFNGGGISRTYKYGETYTGSKYYPTKKTKDGKSTSSMMRAEKFTSYEYKGSDYLTDVNSVVYSMLFGDDTWVYWVASRGVFASLDYNYFDVFGIVEGYVSRFYTFYGNSRCILWLNYWY